MFNRLISLNSRVIVPLAASVVTLTFYMSCSKNTQKEQSANETLQNQAAQNSNSANITAFDVNDLSILYPLKKRNERGSPGRLIRLTEGNSGLMSDSQFKAILANFKTNFGQDFLAGGGQADLMNSLDKWAVVGMRVDHCARLRLSDPCQDQVRLIAQPIDSFDLSTSDFAMHLIYQPSISAAEFVKETVRIRENHASPANRKLTLGKALGIHPILKAEGLNSEFALALKNDLILKHLSSKNLTNVAVAFIEPNRLQPWIFFLADVRDLSKPMANNIFMFDPGTSLNNCGVETGRMVCQKDLSTGKITDSPQKTAANPSGTQPKGFMPNGSPYLDDFLTLTRKDPDTRTFLSAKKDERMWAEVFNKIENPTLTTVISTNCTACHRTLTERARFRGILNLETTGPGAFTPAPNSGCTPGSGISATEGVKTINVRMFGYLHTDAMLSQRVINETLEVCEHFKKTLR